MPEHPMLVALDNNSNDSATHSSAGPCGYCEKGCETCKARQDDPTR
jgi:hypothetical protein